MMVGKKVRPWCALVQWPGRKPFMVGTFFVEEGTRSREEILKLAEQQYAKEWGACIPVDVPLPDIIRLIPGTIIFVPEEG